MAPADIAVSLGSRGRRTVAEGSGPLHRWSAERMSA
jgi:hypothetical protein